MSNQKVRTYVIERDLPGAGSMTEEQLNGVRCKSCDVLKDLPEGEIEWVHSYVTADKIFCIYKAVGVDIIKEHAAKGGFPCNKCSEVVGVLDPKGLTKQ